MPWYGWIVVALAAVEAGWMLFDGTRALLVGDYVTPRTGPYAGQLGPWTHVVKAVGLEPRSTLMKCIFVAYGAGWSILLICFVVLPDRWTWWAMLAAAVGSLWYLPIGTVVSAIQIVLLIIWRWQANGH